MTEPARPALRFGKTIHFFPGHTRYGLDQHLCDTHAARDGKWVFAMVDQGHANLAAVVGINRARRIGNGDPVFGGEAGAGSDLRFVVGGQGDLDAAGDHDDGASLKGCLAFDSGVQIHPRRLGRLVGR